MLMATDASACSRGARRLCGSLGAGRARGGATLQLPSGEVSVTGAITMRTYIRWWWSREAPARSQARGARGQGDLSCRLAPRQRWDAVDAVCRRIARGVPRDGAGGDLDNEEVPVILPPPRPWWLAGLVTVLTFGGVVWALGGKW